MAAFATSSGAGTGAALSGRRWRTWRRVHYRMAAPGLANAWLVTWARAMGRLRRPSSLSLPPVRPPMQIWVTLQETGLSSALPYALVLLVVALPLPVAAFIWSAHARRRL